MEIAAHKTIPKINRSQPGCFKENEYRKENGNNRIEYESIREKKLNFVFKNFYTKNIIIPEITQNEKRTKICH